MKNLKGINFFGTDGIRGKVSSEEASPLSSLELFLDETLITPTLIDLAVRAFVRMVGGSASSVFATGSDGRDSVTDNALVNAMNNAFASCGAAVDYLGVVPTPIVPLHQIEHGCLGAAMLTASHNPSNQNGIKFFIEGRKLLPEDKMGDYTLSALMVEIARSEEKPSCKPGEIRTIDCSKRVADLMDSCVQASRMKDTHFIIDTAAGAWTRYADAFFSRNGIPFERVSADEKGYNINSHCGVAEIEGHESYNREQAEYAPLIVKKLFENPLSYGIVTDGDGDRGMLLKYDREADCVKVYDGDEESFLVLSLMKAEGKVPADSCVVHTLESDIMASVSFAREFGCRAVITDVGDKWICNCPEKNIVIGFESSGHVIIPLEAAGKPYLSGNGLLTAAMAALALKEGHKSFVRGFSKTWYTYFVDKALFAAQTDLWNEDSALINSLISKELAKKSEYSYEIRHFMDKNVLAFQVLQDGLTVALLISRNSGTEDKNAVYLKSINDLVPSLRPIAQALADNHRAKMRNPKRKEAGVAASVMDEINKNGKFSLSEEQAKDPMMNSVLHALVREGQIKGNGKVFVRA
ncbi:MAG: hypothetical protein IKP61_07580 [Spirochaetales bacterium]|nr:hypothetical protein [Spirochaetales bacterium]